MTVLGVVLYLVVGIIVVRLARRVALALPFLPEDARRDIGETTPRGLVGLAVLAWPAIVLFGLGAGILFLLGQLAGAHNHGGRRGD